MRAFSSLIALVWSAIWLIAWPDSAAAGDGWQNRPHASLRLSAAALEQDGAPAAWAVVEMRLEPGWKIYWRSPGEAGVPTTIDWSGSKNLRAAETRWPRPKRARIWNVDTVGYGGEIRFPAALQLRDPAAATLLHVRVAYGICREICIPDEAILTLQVEPGGWAVPGQAERLRAALAMVPDPGNEPALKIGSVAVKDGRLRIDAETGEVVTAPDLFLEGPPGMHFGPTVAMVGDDQRRVRFDVPVQGVTPVTFSLVLTFVDGPRAFERRVTAPSP